MPCWPMLEDVSCNLHLVIALACSSGTYKEEEVFELSGCSTIEGDLTLKSPTIVALSHLTSLRYVTGKLQIEKGMLFYG